MMTQTYQYMRGDVVQVLDDDGMMTDHDDDDDDDDADVDWLID